MKNLAFEKFCRTHFIRKDGVVGDLTKNGREAKQFRREQALAKLTHAKNKKMRRVDELYAQAQKWREKEDNQVYLVKVKPIMEEAAALRDEVADIQKKIARIKGSK